MCVENLLFYLIAYIVGGVPFGYLIVKSIAKIDIREHGSGNIGATNVSRVLKEQHPSLAKKAAIATITLDATKGMFVILAGMVYGVAPETLYAVAVLSVIGHCFSPFLGFEGGKGVATTAGVLLVLLPIETLIGLAVWGIMGKVLKISSLSSLTGILVGILSSYVIHPDMVIGSHAPLAIIGFIIFYKHIPNIIRLFQGQEKKVV